MYRLLSDGVNSIRELGTDRSFYKFSPDFPQKVRDLKPQCVVYLIAQVYCSGSFDLFLLPLGLPRRLTSAIHLGGRPRRFP